MGREGIDDYSHIQVDIHALRYPVRFGVLAPRQGGEDLRYIHFPRPFSKLVRIIEGTLSEPRILNPEPLSPKRRQAQCFHDMLAHFTRLISASPRRPLVLCLQMSAGTRIRTVPQSNSEPCRLYGEDLEVTATTLSL